MLKLSWPTRTSDTAIWASRVITGTCSSMSFSHVLMDDSFPNNSFGFTSWLFGGSITSWIFHSLDCLCIKGLKCYMSLTLFKLSSLQVSLETTSLTQQHFVSSERRDLFFLEIKWFWVPLWFRYHVWIGRNASPPCKINMELFFHLWNLIKLKEQKYH